MTHRILLSTLVIDAPPEVRDQTVEFWAAALGAEPVATPMPQYHILRDAASPTRMVVQGLESGPAGVHIDIHTDDLEREVQRLVDGGATLVESWADHPGSWVVLRDPAGMEFCVVWALNPRRPQSDRDDFEARAKEVG
jgi:predicted enzyme related to lactoylglutathione lyase